MWMSNPRHPSIRKKAILLVGSTVCRCGQGLSHWMSCVDGGLLLAVTETHDQTQVRYDRGQDDFCLSGCFSTQATCSGKARQRYATYSVLLRQPDKQKMT